MATAEPPDQDAAAKDYRTTFSELRKELLIKLNRIKPGKGRTLRLYEHGEAPCVYHIVVNKIDHDRKNVIEGDDEGFWKLVKVGRTAADTTQTEPKISLETPSDAKSKGRKPNRMEIVRNDVLKWCTGKKKKELLREDMNMASVLFVLPVDRSSDDEMEEQVRKAFGLQVDKALGKRLDLPVHTEWVLTSQPYIASIKEEIKKKKEDITCDLILQKQFDKKKIPELEQLLLRGVSVEIDWGKRTVSEKAAPIDKGATKCASDDGAGFRRKKEKVTGATPER